jgi:hypothetical protein
MIRVGLVDAGADVMDARLSMDINKPSENHSLITLDKPVVNRLMNQLLAARTINHQLIMSLDSTRANSNRLKALIERSY